MTNTALSRVDRLKAESQVTKIEAEALTDTFNESTGATWFWALIFGPLYFAVHGFWGRALIVFALNWIIIGFFVAPFLAYPAWRERARKKAEQMLLLDKVRHGA